MFLLPSEGSRNCSAGGLYTECTTTPGSSTVMNATLSSSQTEMLLIFRPSLTKTELPCLLCGRPTTRPYQECLALLDLWLCGFLGDIDNWQCLSLHNSDSMDALFNVRSYYNQCIKSARLCMADILMVCDLMW